MSRLVGGYCFNTDDLPFPQEVSYKVLVSVSYTSSFMHCSLYSLDLCTIVFNPKYLYIISLPQFALHCLLYSMFPSNSVPYVVPNNVKDFVITLFKSENTPESDYLKQNLEASYVLCKVS